ncbi:MAG: VanZ family protein [Tyzzerella sp.]|nr:VanZ family protein [Tyzzerella sp.]
MNAKKRRRYRILGKILFVLYILFVFYFLLVSESYGRIGEMQDYRYNLVLFKEIKRFWNYREQLGIFATATNLLGNILIFLPFGFFMPMASRYRSFLTTSIYSLALSLVVELSQLFLKVGCFDVDDLLLNTIGGMLGYITFTVCNVIRRNHVKKTK